MHGTKIERERERERGQTMPGLDHYYWAATAGLGILHKGDSNHDEKKVVCYLELRLSCQWLSGKDVKVSL